MIYKQLNLVQHEDKSTPYIGTVNIGNKTVPCAVLYPETENPIRVFIQREMQRSLKMVEEEDGKQSSGARLNRYLEQDTQPSFQIQTNSIDTYQSFIDIYQRLFLNMFILCCIFE